MVCCWWCCHECECEPLGLPYKYVQRTNKFYTMGYFCSWSCMKSFNLDHFPSHRLPTNCQNISLLRKRSGEKLESIIPAPSRYALQKFGGPLTIEEFRSNLKHHTYNLPTDTVIHREISEQKQLTINSSTHTETGESVSGAQKLSSIINSKGSQNQPLKLKRETPLKRDKNNLETTLGLSRKKRSAA